MRRHAVVTFPVQCTNSATSSAIKVNDTLHVTPYSPTACSLTLEVALRPRPEAAGSSLLIIFRPSYRGHASYTQLDDQCLNLWCVLSAKSAAREPSFTIWPLFLNDVYTNVEYLYRALLLMTNTASTIFRLTMAVMISLFLSRSCCVRICRRLGAAS